MMIMSGHVKTHRAIDKKHRSPIENVQNLTTSLVAHLQTMLLLAVFSRVWLYSWKAGSARILDVVRLVGAVARRTAGERPICWL
jgi:hypothetical protein